MFRKKLSYSKTELVIAHRNILEVSHKTLEKVVNLIEN